jgi:hypothetical protein
LFTDFPIYSYAALWKFISALALAIKQRKKLRDFMGKIRERPGYSAHLIPTGFLFPKNRISKKEKRKGRR